MKLSSPAFRIISLTLIFSLFTTNITATCPGLDLSASPKSQPSNIPGKAFRNMDPEYVQEQLHAGMRSELRQPVKTLLADPVSLQDVNFQGVRNKIRTELIPALQNLQTFFSGHLTDEQGEFRSFLDGLTALSEQLLNLNLDRKVLPHLVVNLRQSLSKRTSGLWLKKDFFEMSDFPKRAGEFQRAFMTSVRKIDEMLSALSDELNAVINEKRSELRSGAPAAVVDPARQKALTVRVAISEHLLRLAEQLRDQTDSQVQNQHIRGFLTAFMKAVHVFDSVTFNHTVRVTWFALELLHAWQNAPVNHGEVRRAISSDDFQRLAFGSLLHDIGKIGIPKELLNKRTKLYDHELEIIMQRFDIVALLRQKEAGADREVIVSETNELKELIERANKPIPLDEVLIQKLKTLGDRTYKDENRKEHPYLTPHELEELLIPRGTLTVREREEIESHVAHSITIVKKLNLPELLRAAIDELAAHHERLDGSGYPNGLKEEEIPFLAQVMAIADLWDALTDSDRPYKTPIPYDKAIEILEAEGRDKKLNPKLVKLFKEKEIGKAPLNSPDDLLQDLLSIHFPDARSELRSPWFRYGTVWGLRLAYAFAFAYSLSVVIPSFPLQIIAGAALSLLVDHALSKYSEVLKVSREKNVIRTLKEILIFIAPVTLIVQHWVALSLPYLSYGFFTSLGANFVLLFVILSQGILFQTFMVKISKNPYENNQYPWRIAAPLLRVFAFIFIAQKLSFFYAELLYRLGFEVTIEIVSMATLIAGLASYLVVKGTSDLMFRFLYKPFKISPKVIAIASAVAFPMFLLHTFSRAIGASDAFQAVEIEEKMSWFDYFYEWFRIISFPVLLMTFIAWHLIKNRIASIESNPSASLKTNKQPYELASLKLRIETMLPNRLAELGISGLSDQDMIELIGQLIQTSLSGEELAYKFKTLGLIDELPASQMQAVTLTDSARNLWRKSDLASTGQYPFSTRGDFAFPETILSLDGRKIHFHGFAHTAAYADEVKALVKEIQGRKEAGVYWEENMKALFRGEEIGIDMKDQSTLPWPILNRFSLWNRLRMLFYISGFMLEMLKYELVSNFPNLLYYLLTGKELPDNEGVNSFAENGKISIFKIWSLVFKEEGPQPITWTSSAYADRNHLYSYVSILRSAAMIDFILKDAEKKGLREAHWIGGLGHQNEMIWMALHRKELQRFMQKADDYYPQVEMNDDLVLNEVQAWVESHIKQPLQPYIFVDMKALTKGASHYDPDSGRWVLDVNQEADSVWMGGSSALDGQLLRAEDGSSYSKPPIFILIGTSERFTSQAMNDFVTQYKLPKDRVHILSFENLGQESGVRGKRNGTDLFRAAKQAVLKRLGSKVDRSEFGLVLHAADRRGENLSGDFNVIFQFDPRGIMVPKENLKVISNPSPQTPLTRRERFGRWAFGFFYPELKDFDSEPEEYAAPVDFRDTTDQVAAMLRMQDNLSDADKGHFYVRSTPVSSRVISPEVAEQLFRSELRNSDDGEDDGWRGSQDDGGDNDFNPMLASTRELQIIDHGSNGREISARVITKSGIGHTTAIQVYSKPQGEAGYYFYVAKLDRKGRSNQPTEYIVDDFSAVQKIEPYLTTLAENPEVQRELRDHASDWQNLATRFALPAAWKSIIQGYADVDELEDEPVGELRMEEIEGAVRDAIQSMLDEKSLEIEFVRWIVDDGFEQVAERAGDLSEELLDKIKGQLSHRNVLEQFDNEIAEAIQTVALQFVREEGGFRASDLTYEGHVLKIDQKRGVVFNENGNLIIKLEVPVWDQRSLKLLIKSDGSVTIVRSWIKGERDVDLDSDAADIGRITNLFESDPAILNALGNSTRWRILLRKVFERNIPESWRLAIDPNYKKRSELREAPTELPAALSLPLARAELREAPTELPAALSLPLARAELRSSDHPVLYDGGSERVSWLREVYDGRGNFDPSTFERPFKDDIRNIGRLYEQDESRAREQLKQLMQEDPKHVVNVLVRLLSEPKSFDSIKALLIYLAHDFGREVANALVGALAEEKIVDDIKEMLVEISNFNAKRVSNALIASLQHGTKKTISEQILFELVRRGHEQFVREAAGFAISNQYESAPFARAFLRKLDEPTKKDITIDQFLRNLAVGKFIGVNQTVKRFHVSANDLYSLFERYGFRLAHRVPSNLLTSTRRRQDIWFEKVTRSELREAPTELPAALSLPLARAELRNRTSDSRGVVIATEWTQLVPHLRARTERRSPQVSVVVLESDAGYKVNPTSFISRDRATVIVLDGREIGRVWTKKGGGIIFESELLRESMRPARNATADRYHTPRNAARIIETLQRIQKANSVLHVTVYDLAIYEDDTADNQHQAGSVAGLRVRFGTNSGFIPASLIPKSLAVSKNDFKRLVGTNLKVQVERATLEPFQIIFKPVTDRSELRLSSRPSTVQRVEPAARRSELRIISLVPDAMQFDFQSVSAAARSVFESSQARSELRKILDGSNLIQEKNKAALVYDRRFNDLGFAPVLAAHAVMTGKPAGLIVATRSELRVIEAINDAFGKIRVGEQMLDPILTFDTPEKAARMMRSELRIDVVHYVHPEGFGISPQISRFFDEIVEFKKSAMRTLELSVRGLLEVTHAFRQIADQIARMA